MRTPIVTDILEMQIAAPFEPSVLRLFQVGGVQLHDNLRREVVANMEPSDNKGIILDLSAATFTSGTMEQAVKLILRVIPIVGLQVVGLLRGSDINHALAETFGLALEDMPRSLRMATLAQDQAAGIPASDGLDVFEQAHVLDIDAAAFDVDAASDTVRKVVASQFDFGDDVADSTQDKNELPVASFLEPSLVPVAVYEGLISSETSEEPAASAVKTDEEEVRTAALEAPAFVLSQARQVLSEAELQAAQLVREAESTAAALLADARANAASLVEQAQQEARDEANRVAARINEEAAASASVIIDQARQAATQNAQAITDSAASAVEEAIQAARQQGEVAAAALREEASVTARREAAVVIDEARAQAEAEALRITQNAEQEASASAEAVIQTAARAAEHQSAFIIDEARTIAQNEAAAILNGVRGKAETEAQRLVEEARSQADEIVSAARAAAEEAAKAIVATGESDALALVTSARDQAESIAAQAQADAQATKQSAESDAVDIVAEALERGSRESEALLVIARQTGGAEVQALKDQVLLEANLEASRIVEQARVAAETSTVRTKAIARQDAQAEAAEILANASSQATQSLAQANAEAAQIIQAAVETANLEAQRIVAVAHEEASSQGDRLLGDALQVVERVCRSAIQAPEAAQDTSVARQMVDDAISSGGGYLSARQVGTQGAFAQATDSGVAVDVRTAVIHAQRVRSGAVVVAEDCDLVVVGAVSSGAELKADGNIHVYGALHGRVMAGMNGNSEAQIFCQAFHGEYISIGDAFVPFEQVPPEIRGAAVRFWADDTGIHYERLSQFS